MARSQVFVSYSHKDAKWLSELKKFLTPLVREQPIDIWEDTKLRAGDKWLPTIDAALSSAKVAVLLVSANYLASDFIASREMPPIFDAQSRDGLRIIWVPVSASAYAVTPIKSFQAASDPARPLDTLTAARRNQLWVEICEAIVAAMELPAAAAPGSEEDDGPVENRVVLLYKRGAQPDEDLLHSLEGELARRGVPVWIDRHLRVGMDWARAISDRLERAAAVVPLLSDQSIHSEMLSYEVQVAHQARQRNGAHPKILPVRVRFDAPLASPLDILNPRQHATWTGPRDLPVR
jgi:TIR domain